MNKETGIIMSGDHPRLVLEGLKTQTRRTAGLQKINENPDDWYCCGLEYTSGGYHWHFENGKTNDTAFIKCPYGQVGDRLWVREAHCILTNPYTKEKTRIYKADPVHTNDTLVWKPSIHMFKKDARIWREITEVRVERVQEISREDIRAEGVVLPVSPRYTPNQFSELHQEFIELWDSLNAKRGHGWDKNDWVWVIEFKEMK